MIKLLIVDDELGIVEEVKGFFEEEGGYEVHTADTGKEGIDAISRVQPDLVLLDMKLPDVPGLQVLKFCKETYPQIKVIVNTGYVDQHIIDESERLGRDAFLQKPFNFERLMLTIENVLAGRPSEE